MCPCIRYRARSSGHACLNEIVRMIVIIVDAMRFFLQMQERVVLAVPVMLFCLLMIEVRALSGPDMRSFFK